MFYALKSEALPVDVARKLARERVEGLFFLDGARAPIIEQNTFTVESCKKKIWSVISCLPKLLSWEESLRAHDFLPSWFAQHARDTSGKGTLGSKTKDYPHFGLSLMETLPEAFHHFIDLEAIPFLGGLIGIGAFELSWLFDTYAELAIESSKVCTAVQSDALQQMSMHWTGVYPSVALYEHCLGQWFVFGDTACAGLQTLRDAILAPCSPVLLPGVAQSKMHLYLEGDGMQTYRDAHAIQAQAIYQQGVQYSKEAIYQGELFEVNYTERFHAQWQGCAFSCFERLRLHATGNYVLYLDLGDCQILSVSPEQYLEVSSAGRLRTQPIKGSSARHRVKQRDAAHAKALLQSAKNRAENVMIVDLMRNDLTRICDLGSVEVTKLCKLESFQEIHHLVSTVEGQLASNFTPLEAWMACFPPGSISGAPKLRSIELIAQLEHSRRGFYTGSVWYHSVHGRFDSSVLIRTLTFVDGALFYGAGGAVVADSDPEHEYREALLKTTPFQKMLNH